MDSNRDLVTVKGTVNISELKSTVKRELKRDIEVVIPPKKDTTATEKEDKETGATNKKEKEVEASETVRTRKNSEGEGNASVKNKRENKDIRRSSHRMNGETSTSTGSSRQETVNDSMRSYPNNPSNQRSVDPRYYYGPRYHGYYRPPPPPPPANYSNGLDMFSDENPHSCLIM